jgi:hypothetical protein
MIITQGDVMYRVRMMYNGDCLYRWYFSENTYVKNYDFYYSFQLPIEYENYTCVGSKNKVERITSDVDLQAEMIPPAGDKCTVVFYDDEYIHTIRNIVDIIEVNRGDSITNPPIMEDYEEGDILYRFIGWDATLTNITTNIFTTPFSFIVNNVIIGYRVDKAIIKSDPINRDIIDKIKAFNDTGRDKPIGFGKKIVITIIGILLNNTLEYL